MIRSLTSGAAVPIVVGPLPSVLAAAALLALGLAATYVATRPEDGAAVPNRDAAAVR